MREIGPRVEVAALAAIVVLAVVLRSVNLLSLPIFNDEAVYLRWAADIVDQRTWLSLFIPVFEDGKQPMFIWLSVAAMTFVHDPLLAGRIVSVVAGTASLLGIWLAGRWLGGRTLGILVALLYAVTPYTLVFDRMALADSQVSATAIWTLALGVFAATRLRTVRVALLLGALLGGVMAFGVWVKPTALFALPVPVLCALLLRESPLAILGVFRGSPRLPVSPSPRSLLLCLVAAYAVFAAIASLLVVMPYAENQLVLLATHVYSADELEASLPVSNWQASAALYWQWFQAYLPAPLWCLSILGLLWGLVRRPWWALLFLGCWAAVLLPSVAMAHYFSSRYVVNSVFPLVFLAAIPILDISSWLVSSSPRVRVSASLLSLTLAVLAGVSSLVFDARLLSDPNLAPWPTSDRKEYLEGWPAGSGFKEALDLALSKAREYSGQEVFIMSDQIQGFPHDGLALYIRNMPGIRHYVEAEIAWGGRGVVENWRSHNAHMLIVRDDGRHNPETFEARTPEAKLLGTFWKPGGKSSFRVYELDMTTSISSSR